MCLDVLLLLCVGHTAHYLIQKDLFNSGKFSCISLIILFSHFISYPVFSFFELLLVRHGTIWLDFPTLSYFLFLSLLALALRTLFLICLQFLITIYISWNCICGNSPGPGLMMSSSGENCIASRLVLGGTINLKPI